MEENEVGKLASVVTARQQCQTTAADGDVIGGKSYLIILRLHSAYDSL